MKPYRVILIAVIAAGVPVVARAQELPQGAKKGIKAAAAAQKNPDVPPELSTPRINALTEKMRLLIVQGLKDGKLTSGEARSLELELRRIERNEKDYKRDGEATKRERKDLRRDINDLHERIWKGTHNGASPTEPLDK